MQAPPALEHITYALHRYHFSTKRRFVATLPWVYWHHFPNSSYSPASLCHILVILPNISNVFIIIIIVMVIYDQWSLMLLRQKDYNLLKLTMMASIFNYKIVFFNTTHLRDYNTSITALGKQTIHVTGSIATVTLL